MLTCVYRSALFSFENKMVFHTFKPQCQKETRVDQIA